MILEIQTNMRLIFSINWDRCVLCWVLFQLVRLVYVSAAVDIGNFWCFYSLREFISQVEIKFGQIEKPDQTVGGCHGYGSRYWTHHHHCYSMQSVVSSFYTENCDTNMSTNWNEFDSISAFFFSQTEYISVHHSTAIFIEVTYPLLSTFIFHRYFSFKTHRNIIHLLLFKRSQFNYVLYPPFHEDITWCTQNDTRSIKLDYVET